MGHPQIIAYWRENKHVYVCSSKVGSGVIRGIFREELDFPSIHLRKNQLKKEQRKYRMEHTPAAQEGERELCVRSVLYLVRCPFHRAVSSYKYRVAKRFHREKLAYLSEGIDVDAMNIVEYISFIGNEIKDGKYNSTIEHCFPQRRSFFASAFEGTKVKLLWQTEKINELIQV